MCNEYKKPNIELVKEFINKEDAVNYSFRLENKKLTDESDGIINFKKFKMDSSMFDCDSCELAMSIWCVLLEKANFVKEVLGYQGRRIRYIDSDGNTVDVETDTINSLETELNKFVRRVIYRRFDTTWVNMYTSGSKIEKGELKSDFYEEKLRKKTEKNRDSWFVENYKQLFEENSITKEEQQSLIRLNSLANKVHTVGNFMIGPIGFNFKDKKAKSHCNDRFDLFIKRVLAEEEYCKWKQWFLRARDALYIDDYFLGSFNDNTTSKDIVKLRSHNTEIWASLICSIIEKRSEKIIQELKDILNE